MCQLDIHRFWAVQLQRANLAKALHQVHALPATWPHPACTGQPQPQWQTPGTEPLPRPLRLSMLCLAIALLVQRDGDELLHSESEEVPLHHQRTAVTLRREDAGTLVFSDMVPSEPCHL